MVQQKVVFLLYDTKIKFFPIMWMAILLMIPTLIRAQHVPHAIVEDVNRYVFEVVVPKEASENVMYDASFLPDFSSYKDKQDRYYSVGSAFLLNTGEFVTFTSTFRV